TRRLACLSGRGRNADERSSSLSGAGRSQPGGRSPVLLEPCRAWHTRRQRAHTTQVDRMHKGDVTHVEGAAGLQVRTADHYDSHPFEFLTAEDEVRIE